MVLWLLKMDNIQDSDRFIIVSYPAGAAGKYFCGLMQLSHECSLWLREDYDKDFNALLDIDGRLALLSKGIADKLDEWESVERGDTKSYNFGLANMLGQSGNMLTRDYIHDHLHNKTTDYFKSEYNKGLYIILVKHRSDLGTDIFTNAHRFKINMDSMVNWVNRAFFEKLAPNRAGDKKVPAVKRDLRSLNNKHHNYSADGDGVYLFKILSEDDTIFLGEYNRICNSLGITEHPTHAIKWRDLYLSKQWKRKCLI